jgi:hypothetical protein
VERMAVVIAMTGSKTAAASEKEHSHDSEALAKC